jgi:hypothetical protein
VLWEKEMLIPYCVKPPYVGRYPNDHSMQKVFTTLLLSFILANSFGQTQRKLPTYLVAQYNNTLYDVTKGNNPWGVGIGLQTFIHNNTKFKPVIELTGDIYLTDDKVFRVYPDGTEITSVRGLVTLFAGSSFTATQNIYLSFVAGPAFISGKTFLGIKPSFDFYFSKSKKWKGAISYCNIFNRDKVTNKDFGSLSVAIGLKLF